MPTSFGTAQRPWINVRYTGVEANFLAAGAFAYSHDRPETYPEPPDYPDPPGPIEYFVLNLDEDDPVELANSLALVFYGSTREGSYVQEARARIWAVSQGALVGHSPGAWMGMHLGDLLLKLGTTEVQPYDNSVIPGGTSTNPMKFVSDIIITSDRSLTPPAMRVVGQDATEGACMLLLDSIGAACIVVQLTVKRSDGGAAGMLNCGLCYRTL